MSQIGERIKKVRKLTGLSQALFVKRIGINRGHLSNIETNRAVPSNQLIKSISREFNVNEKWLKEEKGPLYDRPPTHEPIQIQPRGLENENVVGNFTLLRGTLEDIQYEGLIKKLKMAKRFLKHFDKQGWLKQNEKFSIRSGHPKTQELMNLKEEIETTLAKLQKSISSIFIAPDDK